MERTNVIVIGGGMSGMAAAYELTRRGVACMLLERSHRLGGVIQTESVDGYLIDSGPDSFIIEKPWAKELCGELGISDHLVEVPAPNRQTLVLKGRRLLPLPEGMILGIPTRIAPMVTTRLFSWLGKFRMLMETQVPVGTAEDESIGSFVRRRLGNEACDKLAAPLLSGIHAGDPDKLSIHATFPRLVALEKEHGSLVKGVMKMPRPARGAPKRSPFVTLQGGLREIVEGIERAIGPSIRLKTDVVGIHREGDAWQVRTSAGRDYVAPVIICTAPAYIASDWLQSLDSKLAAELIEIRYVSTANVFLGWDAAACSLPLNASGFLIPPGENRPILACTWTSSKFDGRAPKGRILFRVFFGGARKEEQAALTDDALVAIAREQLADIMKITAHPELVRVYRWPRSNPQYEVGHLARMKRIRGLEAKHPGLFLTGSGYEGVGIPDTTRQGRETARRAAELLGN